jgi:hypothetical protein
MTLCGSGRLHSASLEEKNRSAEIFVSDAIVVIVEGSVATAGPNNTGGHAISRKEGTKNVISRMSDS